MKQIKQQQLMMNGLISGAVLISLWLLCSCAAVAPVNSSFESAKILDKGQIELKGNYSSYFWEADKINNNLGFRIGYGISNRIDLKLKYERLLPVFEETKEYLDGVNYIAVTPRFAILEDRIAGGADVGLYRYTNKENNELEQSYVISPKIAFTHHFKKNFDLTLTGKIIAIEDEGSYWGLNLGCGVSSDIDRWSLRPEIGYMQENFFTWGLAFMVNLKTR